MNGIFNCFWLVSAFHNFTLLFIPLPVFQIFLICVMFLYIGSFWFCIARISPSFHFQFLKFFCNIQNFLFNTAISTIFHRVSVACIVWMSFLTRCQINMIFKKIFGTWKANYVDNWCHTVLTSENDVSGLRNSHPVEGPLLRADAEPWPGALCILQSCPASVHTQTFKSHRKYRAEQVELSNTSFESTEVGKCLDCRDVVWVGRYIYNKLWRVNAGKKYP